MSRTESYATARDVLDDVQECDEGLCVFIRVSKTDVDAAGTEVSIPYGQHPQTCPVRVVRAWKAALAARGITTGRLLRSLPHQRGIGAELGTKAVSTIVREPGHGTSSGSSGRNRPM